MNRPWSGYKNLKCVILCAGKGRRTLPHSSGKAKAMIEINGKPLLGYVVNYWKRFTNHFIFVVGYKKEQIMEFVKELPTNSQFVEQKELKGIAHALLCAESFLGNRFIVVLGDCICKGNFDFPKDMEQGVGVWKTNNLQDIKRSYSIEIRGDLISKVKEKPKRIINNLCGMGFYFFNRRVFDYIRLTKPSKLRNEIEITDVIQKMIDGGEKIRPVFFEGNYLNITYPKDLQMRREVGTINANRY